MILRFLVRMWIPLVMLLVIALGGLTVARVHGIFGSEKRPSYAEGPDPGASNPKQVVYEVYGAAGTVADINYLDTDLQPQQIDGAHLPWSFPITVNSTSVVANLVAQGDSHRIGCRILVDGVVKAERVSNEVNAFTHCLVQGA